MKKLVVLTGAGISAESGLKTFRGSGGLWEGYRLEEVATPFAWERDPELVLRFYNERRRGVLEAQPNAGHRALVELERRFQVQIVTQNIDDLHERAGSSNVLHLHGEICKSRSTRDPRLVYEIEGSELNLGDVCKLGSQLRPHIVWFHEPVPLMEEAVELARRADLFLVVGTSLVVYPAAGLIDYVPQRAAKYLVDPNAGEIHTSGTNLSIIELPATKGLPQLAEELLSEAA